LLGFPLNLLIRTAVTATVDFALPALELAARLADKIADELDQFCEFLPTPIRTLPDAVVVSGFVGLALREDVGLVVLQLAVKFAVGPAFEPAVQLAVDLAVEPAVESASDLAVRLGVLPSP
jgi:hypothetical protein